MCTEVLLSDESLENCRAEEKVYEAEGLYTTTLSHATSIDFKHASGAGKRPGHGHALECFFSERWDTVSKSCSQTLATHMALGVWFWINTAAEVV
jgi:hypothetical protein